MPPPEAPCVPPAEADFMARQSAKNTFYFNNLIAITLPCTGPLFRVTPTRNSDSFFARFEGAFDG